MVDYHEVKRSLKHYVKHILPVMEGIPPPNEDDRAFYPTDKDIQNHIYMAKRAHMLSNLDQENLHLLIEKWRKECATLLHFFRPYRKQMMQTLVTVVSTHYCGCIKKSATAAIDEIWQYHLFTRCNIQDHPV